MDKSFMLQRQRQFEKDKEKDNSRKMKSQGIQRRSELTDKNIETDKDRIQKELNVNQKELNDLDDDQPGSEYFERTMDDSPLKKRNKKATQDPNFNPNLMDSDEDSVDSFTKRNDSSLGKNKNEFSKMNKKNNDNKQVNKKNNLNDSLGAISNPNLLDSDEDF